MIWPVLHRLFGWHYVHLKNTADEIVRRVRHTAGGERYVVYFGSNLVFIDRTSCGWTVSELTDQIRSGEPTITYERVRR